MAAQAAALEPERSAFEATVEAVNGTAIELSETYFYAESGGQPADRGMIDGIPVEHVSKEDGRIVHHLADEPAWEVGDTVAGEIDDTFRRYCMCAHTASHAVYGAARTRFDELGYGGFEIGPEKTRIDLKTPTPLDDDDLFYLERATNEVIWEDRPVTWSEWPAEEVKADDRIALNVATEVVETEPTVRVVEIEDWDLAACGGTHVRSTGEIGPVTMLDRSNPGEGLTRVEFTVGSDRIEHRQHEKQAAWTATQTLGVALSEVPNRIVELQSTVADLETDLADTRRQLVAARLEDGEAARFTVDGREWAVASLPDAEANTAAEAAASLQGDAADVLVITGGDDRGHVVVATPGDPAADTIVDEVLGAFDGGGGGGSAERAQAGGLDASADDLAQFVREQYGAA